MDNTVSVLVSQLDSSQVNARRTGGKKIDDLLASIPAHGLLQPPVVRPGAEGRFEVVDGSRRLRALRQLMDEKFFPEDLEIKCVLLSTSTDEAALEASVAANIVREGMHPHDEFVAFRDMAAQGKPVEDIAASFGVAPIVVQRRLKLANVSPVLLRLFREDKLTLAQMQALAITDDHAAQEAAWNAAHDSWDKKPDALRRALTPKEIPTSDERVRFVGLDVYESEGGPVHRDLFDEAGGGYVADEALLDRLVRDRLESEGSQLQTEGWKFVHVHDGPDTWKFTQNFDRSSGQRVKPVLSDEQTAKLRELKAAEKTNSDAIDAAENDGDLYEDDPLLIEQDRIRHEIAQLEQPIETFSDRAKAKAGALVAMRDGRLIIERGLIPREDAKSQHSAAKAEAASKGEAPPAKIPTLAESMVRRLTAHRTIALQSALIANAPVALAAVAHALLGPLLYPGSSSVLNIRGVKEFGSFDRLGFPDVTASPTLRTTGDALAELRKALGVPGEQRTFWPWLVRQKTEAVVSLIASAAVLTVNAVAGDPDGRGSNDATYLIEALDVDMADFWQPDAERFLSLVAKPLMLEAVKEVAGADAAISLEALKKDEVIVEAGKLLANSGWLPKPLRRPGYKLRKSKAPKAPDPAPAPKPAAGKAAAKKVAKKTAPKKAAKKPAKKATKKAAKRGAK